MASTYLYYYNPSWNVKDYLKRRQHGELNSASMAGGYRLRAPLPLYPSDNTLDYCRCH